MVGKKKYLLVVSMVAFVATASTLASFGARNNVFKSSASGVYSCELPNDYVEIDEAIEYAFTYGESSPVDNPYFFRGTVSRRHDDFCFLQRVNQTSYYLDAIKVVGLNDYANKVSEGCVLDIRGGQLSIDYDTVTLTLTSSDDCFISFESNPYGCSPRVYADFEDADQHAFECKDSNYGVYYATNRYVEIRDVTVDIYDSSSTMTLGNEQYYYGAFFDKYNDDSGYYFAFEDNYDDFYDKIVNAISNSLLVNIRGVLYFHGGRLVLLLKSSDDISITDHSSIDTTLIVERRNSRMLWGADDENYFDFTLYFINGKDDVPYVNVGQFINYSHALYGAYQEKFMFKYLDSNYENTAFFYNDDYGYYEVNAEDDYILTYSFIGQLDYTTVRSSGYRLLRDDFGEQCQLDVDYSVHHTSYNIGDDTVSWNPVVTYNLLEFNLDIVQDSFKNFYAPLNPMMDIMLNNDGLTFVYNGRDIYFVYSLLNDSNLENMFYVQSPLVGEETRTQAYADYTYNALCFSLKYCYGLFYERGEYSPDVLFTNLGLKNKLLSTNCVDYEEAMAEFEGKWLYDGHAQHSKYSPFGNDYQSQDDDNYNRFENIYRNYCLGNDRYNQLWDSYDELGNQRAAAGKDIGVSFYGDTAIITFDGFSKLSGNYADYYPNLDNYSYQDLHDIGSELFFAKAFKDIAAHDGIANVVIDITHNGGGAVAVVPWLLAYFTEHPSYVINYKTDGEVEETAFKVDLNCDGVFDENDTFAGQYNFYCMNSRFSFSCGNFFPTILKAKGWATLIGERSGGGICAVGFLSTAAGTILRNSSNFQLGYFDEGTGNFNAFEDGVEPDHAFSREYFYNDEEIYNFIHNL